MNIYKKAFLYTLRTIVLMLLVILFVDLALPENAIVFGVHITTGVRGIISMLLLYLVIVMSFSPALEEFKRIKKQSNK